MKYVSASIGFAGVVLYAAAEDYIRNTGIQTSIPVIALGVIVVGVAAVAYFGVKEITLKAEYRKRKEVIKNFRRKENAA